MNLIAILAAVSGILFADENRLPAEDLLPHRRMVKPEDNGWIRFKFLRDKLPEIPEEDRKQLAAVLNGETSSDGALLRRITSGTDSLLPDVQNALALPEWQWPEVSTTEEAQALENRSNYRTPFLVLQASMLTAWEQGDFDAALTCFKTMHRLCCKDIEGAGRFHDAAVSTGLFHRLIRSVPFLLNHPVQPDDSVWAAIQETSLHPIYSEELMAGITRGDYFFISTILDKEDEEEQAYLIPVEGTWWVRMLRFKRNATLNRLSTLYRSALHGWLEPSDSLAESRWERFYGGGERRREAVDYQHPNLLGEAVIRGQMEIIGIIDSGIRVQMALSRMMALRIALHRWQMQHQGNFPETLDELTPRFMENIPDDPFDGKPLRWDSNKKVIYALGRDWREDIPLFEQTAGWIELEAERPGIRINLPVAEVPAEESK